jgi:hypothetical protein
VFRNLRLRGTAGSVLWGYRTVASVRHWTIVRKEDKPIWFLSASLERADAFQLRQTPLLFTAPRVGAKNGLWCFPLIDVQVANGQLRAKLGPPEQ